MKEVRAGRSRLWAAGLVLCTGLVALAYFLLTRPDTAVLPPRVSPTQGEFRSIAAADLLDDLVAVLSNGDRAQIVKLAAAGDQAAARELAALHHNVRELGITDLSMRYVDEHVTGAASDKTWTADVQVSWRLERYDESSSNLEVTMTFRQTHEGAAFVSARRGSNQAAPLWMLDRLAVREGRRALVMAARPDQADRFAKLADQAVRDVHRMLPEWRDELVVAVPSTQDQLIRVLGASEGAYAAIAAVTTSVDGSASGDAIRVFINPPVFAPLGERGSQIVMSHEAAHVATGAAASGMPTWLLEGFADYVALAHVDLPVDVTASQILEQVRQEGPPHRLPGPDDFRSRNGALGAAYEAAWLACRLIAEEYGEQTLIEFYRQTERDGDTRSGFRSILGTTEEAFTQQWRTYLQNLAG